MGSHLGELYQYLIHLTQTGALDLFKESYRVRKHTLQHTLTVFVDLVMGKALNQNWI